MNARHLDPVIRLTARLALEPDDPESLIALVRAEDGYDVFERLDRVAAPALILSGGRDIFYPGRARPGDGDAVSGARRTSSIAIERTAASRCIRISPATSPASWPRIAEPRDRRAAKCASGDSQPHVWHASLARAVDSHAGGGARGGGRQAGAICARRSRIP